MNHLITKAQHAYIFFFSIFSLSHTFIHFLSPSLKIYTNKCTSSVSCSISILLTYDRVKIQMPNEENSCWFGESYKTVSSNNIISSYSMQSPTMVHQSFPISFLQSSSCLSLHSLAPLVAINATALSNFTMSCRKSWWCSFSIRGFKLRVSSQFTVVSNDFISEPNLAWKNQEMKPCKTSGARIMLFHRISFYYFTFQLRIKQANRFFFKNNY